MVHDGPGEAASCRLLGQGHVDGGDLGVEGEVRVVALGIPGCELVLAQRFSARRHRRDRPRDRTRRRRGRIWTGPEERVMPVPPPGLSGLPLWAGTARRRAALRDVSAARVTNGSLPRRRPNRPRAPLASHARRSAATRLRRASSSSRIGQGRSAAAWTAGQERPAPRVTELALCCDPRINRGGHTSVRTAPPEPFTQISEPIGRNLR